MRKPNLGTYTALSIVIVSLTFFCATHDAQKCIAAEVYDLASDWSDAVNPNGLWSYNGVDGLPLPIHRSDWDSQTRIEHFSSPQPAWSAEDLSRSVPMAFKSLDVTAGTIWNLDAPAGRVGMHGQPLFAGVTWTSPASGTATVSGGVWKMRKNNGRIVDWHLTVNGLPLTVGTLTDADPYTSSSPFDFANGSSGPTVLTIPVLSGDIIGVEAGFPTDPFHSDFVGVDFSVSLERTECNTSLTFNSPVPDTLNDANGIGTGFTHRLPGTGSALPANDPNMDLVTAPGKLRLTSTHADINQPPYGGTGNNLPILEAPGSYVPGIEDKDVVVKAIFEDVGVPNGSDQLLLYAGVNENRVIRAGIHAGNVFIISANNGAGDINTFGALNAFSTGDDIEVTLSRRSGLWSLSWNNLTTLGTGSLPGVSFPSLDAEPDLYFGVHAANAGSEQSFSAQIDDFSVTCVPEPSTSVLIATSFLAMGVRRFTPRRLRIPHPAGCRRT
jgi:hypothetical protein